MKTDFAKWTPEQWGRAIADAFRSSTIEGVLCMGAAFVATWLNAQNAACTPGRSKTWVAAPPPPPTIEEDDDDGELEALTAALLLGVRVDARPDEIRAALRRRMSEARVHPDQGGDEKAARRFIDAKNLLVERAVRAT